MERIRSWKPANFARAFIASDVAQWILEMQARIGFVVLVLMAISIGTAQAYDGPGKGIPNITDPGMSARYLWRDVVEDGNKESLMYGYDGDHLAAIVANLNYAAWKNSYATGDFDGNGCQDLAVGTPYATVAGVPAAGRVRVLFYQPVAPPPPPGGITVPGPQQTCALWREEVYSMAETEDRRTMFRLPGLKFSPPKGGFVGFSMATGDFNCDGVNDLAVGAPGIYYETCDEFLPCPRKGGGVFIGYGRPNTGLDFHQEPNSATLSGVFTYWSRTVVPAKFQLPEPNEDGPWVREFALRGYSLAAGRFFPAVAGSKCDAGIGLPDLAIGAPGQNLGSHPLGDDSKPGAGIITIVRGDSTGLNAAQGVINFDESDFGVKPSPGSVFGFSLAAGRFHSTVSGDYHALAIGAPGKDSEQGRVYVVRGGAGGPTIPPGTQKCISQNGGATCIDIMGGTENGDRFGFALASGDFNGDGFADLAIGNPGEQIDQSSPGQGCVSLLLGSPIALIAQTENLYPAHPDPKFSLNADRQNEDAVGYALAAGDFDGDGYADLAIGVPGREVITRDAGAVVIKYGGCQGFPNCAVGNHQGLSANEHVQWLHRNSPNPLDDLDGAPAGPNELVGVGLLAADLDRNGRAGLVIGAPGQTIPDPFIEPLVGFGAFNFRTYTAFTYFVPGRPGGLDATFENQTTVPWTDSLNGELAVVIIPKVSNFSIPFGILDMFNQALQKALANAPNGTTIGQTRFAVIDSLVPHPPAHPSTYTNVAVFDNLIRFEVPVKKGPAKGTVRGYLSAHIDTTDNSLVVNAAWEPNDFSAIVMAFFGDEINAIAGSQFMKIDPSQLGVKVGTLTHVQILPSMELEVGLKP